MNMKLVWKAIDKIKDPLIRAFIEKALQDQAEREKGCEICKSDVPMIFDTFTGMDGKPVNFCPNCGRDLRKPVQK